ncbi:unnamed protein product [Laminaria digitata]
MADQDVDIKLLQGVFDGNMRGVEAALASGASVDGPSWLPCSPIAGAAAMNKVKIANLLIGRGADPARPASQEVPCPGWDLAIMPGERALHTAAMRGHVEIVRSLLKRAHADPNATDRTGCTALLLACACPSYRMEVVRLLLEAGADPALAESHGYNPLHLVAQKGHIDLVDMLYKAAPTALNRYSSGGETPLSVACSHDFEGVAIRLLRLGAVQRMPVTHGCMLPLAAAAEKGYEGVVRILLNEGFEAVGGTATLPMSLHRAVCYRRPRILRMLLAVSGKQSQPVWASIALEGRSLLHYGAGHCCPASVNVLLKAGASAATRDTRGRTPAKVIGADLGLERLRMDGGKKVAIRRMLEQGQAYRARSWAWPTKEAGGGGDGGGAVPSSSPAAPKLPVGLKIFRPENNSRRVFVNAIGRYCAKD